MESILLLQQEKKIVFSMLSNPLKTLTKKEWLLWLASLAAVIISNFATNDLDLLTLISALLGVTSLIFAAKGSVWAQFLMIVFCIFFPFPLLGRNDYLSWNDSADGCLVSDHMASKPIRRK